MVQLAQFLHEQLLYVPHGGRTLTSAGLPPYVTVEKKPLLEQHPDDFPGTFFF